MSRMISRSAAKYPLGFRVVTAALAVGVASVACEKGAETFGGRSEAMPDTAWFVNEAAERGLTFVHESGHAGRCLFPEIMAGGVALFDMDHDGDLDAYLVQSGSLVPSDRDDAANRLYRNLGNGNFEDATTGSGADDEGYGMGVTTGDYDNDGDVDVYVTNVGPNVLLRNHGDGTFTNVTAQAGVGNAGWSTSAAFVDYDADGDLDLFVANYVHWSIGSELTCHTPSGQLDYCSPNSYSAPMPDVLYRNNGDGTFTDVSAEAGLRAAFGNGLGVVCGDFDHDGFMDIFVANDQLPNQLWRNLGNGSFRDVALLTGCAVDQHGDPKAGMGAVASDVDDDGDLDLLVVNLRAQSDSFFRNEGDYFVDDTPAVGLGAASRPFTRFGVALLDFNNDGWLDVYEANGRVLIASTGTAWSDDPYAEPNLLLHGKPDGRFEESTLRGGTADLLVATSRGAAFGDLNNDGGVDVVVANRDGSPYLLRNIVRNRGHWILLKVINEHGGDALGATVTLQHSDRTVSRVVATAYSYCAANDPRVHVGLGQASEVADVTVHWVDGTVESFGRFDADRVVTLRRGEGVVIEHHRPQIRHGS